MSQPKRYINGRYGLDPHESGEWVMWDDYAALAADRTKWINLSVEHEKEVSELQGKVAALAAENERLRKAGDRLASATIIFETMSEEDRVQRRAEWKAAKEGGAK